MKRLIILILGLFLVINGMISAAKKPENLAIIKQVINDIEICKGCNLTQKQQDELRRLMGEYRSIMGHLCSLTCQFDFINLRPEERTRQIEKHFGKLVEVTGKLKAFYKKTGAQPCCKLPAPKEVLDTLKLGDQTVLTSLTGK